MSLKLGNSLCKHQSVIKVTRWNLKVISLCIPLHCVPETQNVCESCSLEKSIDKIQSIPEMQLVVNKTCILYYYKELQNCHSRH